MSITAQNLVVFESLNGRETFNVTPFIAVPSYKVDDKPLGDSWQDSNWISHVDIVRYKAQGTFTVWFDNLDDYEAFADFVESQKDDENCIKAHIYLNKQRITKHGIYVMVNWEPQNDLPLYGVKQHDGYEITIEER